MQIEAVQYKDGHLMLATQSTDARRLIVTFKPGEYELVKAKKKRSLSANAYCWKLCDEIAKSVGLTKEDVYRRAIGDVGVFDQLEISLEALGDFKRRWESRGEGWVVKTADSNSKSALVFAYYGSSVYDRGEMSRLIDNLVQDCRALDIETLSERELSLLKDDWNG